MQALCKTKEGVQAIWRQIGMKSAKASVSARIGRPVCPETQCRSTGPSTAAPSHVFQFPILFLSRPRVARLRFKFLNDLFIFI